MKCFELRAPRDVANVLAALQQAPPAPLPTNAACVLLFQLITPQTQYATRLTLILLPPCDRSTPCMVSQYRGGAQLQFRKNQDMTSALMTLSHVLTPRVRPPFRDHKLILYLRPFLSHAAVTLLGCLPPYSDAAPATPAAYKVRPLAPAAVTSREQKRLKAAEGVKEGKNTENFASILKYCAALFASNTAATRRPALSHPRHLPAPPHRPHDTQSIASEHHDPTGDASAAAETLVAELEKVKKMAIAFQNRFGNEAGVADGLLKTATEDVIRVLCGITGS
ncbi:hypothetical protein WA577_006214, partial [Blastocystis sp. JDR]